MLKIFVYLNLWLSRGLGLYHPVILLPAHPASFAHNFYFSESVRVPGCNSIADLSLKIVVWTHKFAVGTH